ncbi:class I SAM-dependent methyltransferase [Chloroflexota bacterium]
MSRHFTNPIRGRFNAWILHFAGNADHKTHGKWKQQIFEDLPDSFVELGPGTGGNFRYYRQGSLLTAIEPNRMMLDRLRKKAEQHGINLDILESGAEKLDLADESVEAVVSTQVLCTVGDLNQVLKEVYRVLRPGGRFLFLEHIAAPKGTFLRRFQDLSLVHQPWRWFFEGCNLNCQIDSALETAGFSKVELEHYKLKSLLPVPIRHYIAGIATK